MNGAFLLVKEFVKTNLTNIQIFIVNLMKKLLPKLEIEFTVEFKVKVQKRETES